MAFAFLTIVHSLFIVCMQDKWSEIYIHGKHNISTKLTIPENDLYFILALRIAASALLLVWAKKAIQMYKPLTNIEQDSQILNSSGCKVSKKVKKFRKFSKKLFFMTQVLTVLALIAFT